MAGPNWVREDVVLAIHARQLAEHGGAGGLRDPNGLSAALARPRNLLAYSEQAPDVAALAAAYAHGICQGHPFVDGNKRVALVVAQLFIRLNGGALEATQAEKYQALMRLASGEWDKEAIAAWFRDCIRG